MMEFVNITPGCLINGNGSSGSLHLMECIRICANQMVKCWGSDEVKTFGWPFGIPPYYSIVSYWTGLDWLKFYSGEVTTTKRYFSPFMLSKCPLSPNLNGFFCPGPLSTKLFHQLLPSFSHLHTSSTQSFLKRHVFIHDAENGKNWRAVPGRSWAHIYIYIYIYSRHSEL